MMRTIFFCLFSLLAGCDPTHVSRQLPPWPREIRVAAPVENNPFCGGEVEVAPWAIDCVPRCLPKQRLHIACHEGLEWHYFVPNDIAITSEWGFTANGACDGEPAFDVYRIALEERTAEMLDGAANGTWEEDVADGDWPCANKPKDLLVNYFADRPDRRFYLGYIVLP